MTDTYTKPEHGWTCFHCGETFTTLGSARDHFGATPVSEPGCVLKVNLGGERGLLMALRKTEALLATWMDEATDIHKSMHAQQTRHSGALEDAEIAGYERGLRDAKKDHEAALKEAVAKEREECAQTIGHCGGFDPHIRAQLVEAIRARSKP